MTFFYRYAGVILAIALFSFSLLGQSTKMSPDEGDLRSALGK